MPAARVQARSRGRIHEEQSVEQWLKSKAADYRGYSTDEEHLYEERQERRLAPGVSAHVVGRRSRGRRRGIHRRRK